MSLKDRVFRDLVTLLLIQLLRDVVASDAEHLFLAQALLLQPCHRLLCLGQLELLILQLILKILLDPGFCCRQLSLRLVNLLLLLIDRCLDRCVGILLHLHWLQA